MAVHGGGLELTYRRSARRRGGLEAAVGAVSLVDLSKGAAFSRLVSPGKPQGTVHTSGSIGTTVCGSRSGYIYSRNR